MLDLRISYIAIIVLLINRPYTYIKNMEKISSFDNKLIKSIKKLCSDKKYRDTTNLFVAESYRVVKSLIDNNIQCRNLLFAKDTKYYQNIDSYDKKGISTVEINSKIYESISTLSNSDGVIGIFVKPNNEFKLQPNKKYIVLDKIQNPGNLGTIIRTAVAFNIDGIVITNDSVDLYQPTIVRATMGSLVEIPVKFSTSLEDIIKECKNKKITTYATCLNKNSKVLNEINFDDSSAIIFGNEGQGLNTKDIDLCDESIYIPISNKVDSINISIAAGIIMHKISK
ncbi:RNA methyltransferase [Bacilli bacterium]|nr:RNA methyltransferase [Bacilli bacterium]